MKALMAVSFVDADNVYKCCSGTSFKQATVEHILFNKYYLALRRLEKELADETATDFWHPLLKIMRHYRFEAASAPLSFSRIPCYKENTTIFLEQKKQQVRHVQPLVKPVADEAIDLLLELHQCDDNPVIQNIADLAAGYENNEVAVLIKEPRLINPSVDEFKRVGLYNHITLTDLYQLRNHRCFKRLIIIGSSYWYQDYEYVFNAPRATEIVQLKYDWIKGWWKNKTDFLGSTQNRCDKEESQRQLLEGRYHLKEADEDIFHLETDWGEIRARAIFEKTENEIEYVEDVEARLLLLEGDSAVYVDESDSSRVLVVDIYDNDENVEEEIETASRVKRLMVSQLVPGMFIVLRTSGGGDLIIPLADKIMGSAAIEARHTQFVWKDMLSREVRKTSAEEVARRLKSMGSLIANETNVRNWISPNSIKPRNVNDFRIIMTFLGMKDQTEEYWQNADMIDRAHRKAGFNIRKLLLKKLLETDIEMLYRVGRADFELEEGAGASLSAIRINDISKDSYLVNVAHLNKVFKGGGY